MAKFFEATRSKDSKLVSINVENIIFFTETEDEKTRILFNTPDGDGTKMITIEGGYEETKNRINLIR